MSKLDRIEKNSNREKRVFWQAAVIGAILLIVDQCTKWYFVKNFQLGQSCELLSGFLNFTYVRNIGAAWSMLSGYVWLLLAFGVAAGIAIICCFRTLAEGCIERYFALLMVISGILGNSFDRAFHGAVIDFIHIHYYNIWHYPIFNVADIAICCGVGIYLLSGFCRKSAAKEK